MRLRHFADNLIGTTNQKTHMNYEAAREAMISQQIRCWDVNDERVLDCFKRVPREDYVPDAYLGVAFADVAIPIGHGQSMLKPIVEGRLLQSLNAELNHRVLVVGTGTGYLTACVARLCDHVTSIELKGELLEGAHERLRNARIHNVDLQEIDYYDFSGQSGFDRILLTAALPGFDERLVNWLKPDGLTIATIGKSPAMSVERITRTDEHYRRERLFETVIPSMLNAPEAAAFSF
jgi:protein-L-isoaspartate(D-aspartate) O-methyltransferase